MLASINNYGAIPRSNDRQKTYLFLKEWADRVFEFKKEARHKEGITNVYFY